MAEYSSRAVCFVCFVLFCCLFCVCVCVCVCVYVCVCVCVCLCELVSVLKQLKLCTDYLVHISAYSCSIRSTPPFQINQVFFALDFCELPMVDSAKHRVHQRVQGTGYRVQGTGYRVQGTGFDAICVAESVASAKYRVGFR